MQDFYGFVWSGRLLLRIEILKMRDEADVTTPNCFRRIGIPVFQNSTE
jgi:hypothetical protein